MRYLAPTFLIVLALAGCVAPPQAPEAPPPPVVRPSPLPTTPPPPPLAANWVDWPFTPGDWRYAAASASFAAGGRSLLTMTCDRATRTIVLTGIAAGPVTIRTTTMTRAMAGPAVSLAANDALLDAMAFSRGRIVFDQPGHAPLVLRPDAEIGRVIEDCRG